MHEVRVPNVGENVESVTVARLMVEPGSTVTEGQPVLELETGKAVVELPAPASGVVEQIRVQEGDPVALDALLMVIAEPAAAPTPPADLQPTTTPTRAGLNLPAAREISAPTPEVAPPVPTAAPPSPTPPAVPQAVPAGAGEEPPLVPAGPTTRRLAHQLGVDLRMVRGSGRGGRITLADV